MHRSLFPTAVLVLSLAATAGCSGDPEAPQAQGSSSSSVTASPSAPASPPESETAQPESPEPPKPPKAVDTNAGKKAFARYVTEAWGYALRTNDSAPLVRLSPQKKDCVGCRQLSNELAKRRKQGWYVDLPDVKVDKTEVRTTGNTSVAQMSVNIPESDSYHEDGSYRSTSQAHPKGKFEVGMRFVNGSFELVSFRVS